jgi:GT2 family glycosyltransferase
MKPIDLSIIVCSYKSADLLRLCLGSIQRNVRSVAFEIVVSDGETQEDTAMMMREDFPEVRFVSSPSNVGFGGLVRQGIEASSGKYFFILNPDILITPDSVEKLLNFLKQHPEIGMLGPQLLNFNDRFQQSYFRFYKPMTIVYRRTFLKRFGFAKKHLDWFLMKDYRHDQPKEVDWIQGSAMLVSKEAVEKVGFMDPRFFMYMEDVDWCRRFWEAGYKVVYYPHVRIYHYHVQGSAKGGFLRSLLFNKLTRYHIASALRYFRKYRGKPLPQHR